MKYTTRCIHTPSGLIRSINALSYMKTGSFFVRVWRILSIIGFLIALFSSYISYPDQVAVRFDKLNQPLQTIDREVIFYVAIAIFIVNNTLLKVVSNAISAGTHCPDSGRNQERWAAHRSELNEIFTNWFSALISAVNTILAHGAVCTIAAEPGRPQYAAVRLRLAVTHIDGYSDCRSGFTSDSPVRKPATMTETDELLLSQFQYDLPDDRIARFPLAQRDASKLLVYQQGRIQHESFSQLPELLPDSSFLVFNNTKVIPARLHFTKPTGAVIELFLLNPFPNESPISHGHGSYWHGHLAGHDW